MKPFAPAPWTSGGHRQTLLGYFFRRRIAWSLPAEDFVVPSEESVRLLARASWQPGPRDERPAVVLIHGLASSDAAGYVLATGALAHSLGWHVVRMNMRGAGEAEALSPALYNAGLDTDLLAVLGAVARHAPRVGVVGFSLGGNLALLAMGRNGSRLPPGFLGAAAVSPPLDLAACADRLERPANRGYREYFMTELRNAYRRIQRRRPDLFEAGRERGRRSIRDFDAAITAPYGGYRSVDDYYERSSAGPSLARIDRPALVLAAADDPLVPSASVARWPLAPSGSVRRELLPTGGHVGFVAPTAAPGRFWAAERAMAFLEELASH